MAESTRSIVISAPPADVLAVIADFAAYPEWAKSVKRAEVVEQGADGLARQVRFQVDAGPIQDEYTLRYSWRRGTAGVSWQLTGPSGTQKAQSGSYQLADRGDGTTEVTYTLQVEPAIPMLGLLRRKAERVIMDTALTELKKRVES